MVLVFGSAVFQMPSQSFELAVQEATFRAFSTAFETAARMTEVHLPVVRSLPDFDDRLCLARII